MSSVDTASIIIISILSFCALCCAPCTNGNPDHSTFKRLVILLFAWDFFNDVLWTIDSFGKFSESWNSTLFFACCCISVSLPTVINILALKKSIGVWCNPSNVTEIYFEHYTNYFSNPTLLYFFTVIFGSCVASIELASVCYMYANIVVKIKRSKKPKILLQVIY